MQQTTGSFKTFDGLTIHTMSWQPDGDIKAVVILVHGIAEHTGRYQHVGEFLTAHGYAVYGLDHRGHGRSEGLRTYFDSLALLVNDLKQYFDSVKAGHPNTNLFIYGHSMGSLISLMFTLRYQNELKGLILSGTALEGDKARSGLVLGSVRLLARIMPTAKLIPALPVEELARDPAVTQAYKNDPLVDSGMGRFGTGAALLDSLKSIRPRLGELTLPLLVIHGEADAITPVSGAHFVYEHVRSQDKTLKIYPEMRHEIHNEIGKEAVLTDILDWLVSHT